MRKLCIIILLLFTLPSFAEAPKQHLNRLLSGIKTMRADFVQTIYDGAGKQIQVANGKMALQRPGYFRWETLTPIPQVIIANKNKLWIYDPDLEQVTIRALQQAAGSTPALFLSHTNDDVTKHYEVSIDGENKENTVWFHLKPLSEDNMFEKIDFGFKGNDLTQMRLKDHLGHTTSIAFKHIEINRAISSKTFIFTPNESVDVIDETKQPA